LFLFGQAKRKAKIMITQIEIFIRVMNYSYVIFIVVRKRKLKYFNIENQEFNRSESYLMNICEQFSALNFVVLATELKLVDFKDFCKNIRQNPVSERS
jgi:hypothetical protein